jgi:tetratricopeptide (TPR) repeat protein/tRNA A-37 threonylcarbamoyl transferase component Bud32
VTGETTTASADTAGPRTLQPRGRPTESVAPGTVIGRFIVHRTLGVGSTGVVYAAHDPELDRTIALKVLRRELADRVDARVRFLREAQALARLSHPNVISVYDVGADEHHTFIAMEYIHGQIFADWIATSVRSWRQIVAVLVKAGRGLAAAHAAGLIHRDFKPANLLVAADGRVMVTDFGLARAVAEADADAGVPVESRSSAFARSITRTGAVQGTPAYMAPEQHRSEASDARADQFSFCVTLYEAVFREHPFRTRQSVAASSLTETDAAACVDHEPSPLAGPVPTDMRGVPGWLLRTTQRGLSRRPEDRYPSMDSLLAALTREPWLRRRRLRIGIAALGVALAVIGLAVGIASWSAPVQETCTGADEQLAGVWNATVAGELRLAFLATGRSHAAASAAGVADRLDGYGRDWVAMHRAACRATARGEQSPDLLDRRMACLGRHLAQVGVLLDLFRRSADGQLVDRALGMVATLESLQACADAVALLAGGVRPTDPVRRLREVALQHQIDRAELERQAGRPAAAADAARAVLAAERTLDHAPVAAQARRVLGRSLEDQGRPSEAREALGLAQRFAERAGDTRLAADLLIELVAVVGTREKRSAEGHVLGQLAEATLERPELRGDQAMRARLLVALGSVANEERDDQRAVDLLREALAIRLRILPEMSVEVADAEHNLGIALSNTARNDEARAHYLKALSIRRRVLGDHHPLVASVETCLGVLYMEQSGDVSEARVHFLAALAILRLVPEYRNYPAVLSNLGTLENAVGNYDLARQYHEAALAVRVRQLGPDHLEVAESQHGLAIVFSNLGDFAQAKLHRRRAIAIYEHHGNTSHPWYGILLAAEGDDLLRLGRGAEALGYLERAFRVLSPRFADSATMGEVLALKGLALANLGRLRDGRADLERALELMPPGSRDRARAGFALARILEPRAPTTPRARALAQEALAIYTSTHAAQERSDVMAYLARAAAR